MMMVMAMMATMLTDDDYDDDAGDDDDDDDENAISMGFACDPLFSRCWENWKIPNSLGETRKAPTLFVTMGNFPPWLGQWETPHLGWYNKPAPWLRK